MTDLPICVRCNDRPCHDRAYVCARCAGDVRGELEVTALAAGEASVTIARLDRVTRYGQPEPELEPAESKAANALYPTVLPIRELVAARHDEAVNQLTTWARHVHEESGRPLPEMKPCPHRSCHASTERLIIGPVCPKTHPLTGLSLWLAVQVEWLRFRPEADEAFTVIQAAARCIVGIVDRPPQRVIVGQCACGTYLYAIHGKADVKCQACGTSYDVETSRDVLRRDLDERLLTAAEIATMATYLGLATGREATRKLINKWAERGLVVPHGSVAGDPAYLFGEVVTRLASSQRVGAA